MTSGKQRGSNVQGLPFGRDLGNPEGEAGWWTLRRNFGMVTWVLEWQVEEIGFCLEVTDKESQLSNS